MSLPDARHANSPALAANAADITAAIVAAAGAEPRLGSIALPPRTPGTTLVTVVAAPVNPLDLLIASGTFHSARHEAPCVPGSECVGVVVDSDRFPFGSSVYGECRPSPARSGAFAAQVLINDENLLSLPAGVHPVQAAAVAIPAPRRTCRLSRSPVSNSERRHRFRPVQRSLLRRWSLRRRILGLVAKGHGRAQLLRRATGNRLDGGGFGQLVQRPGCVRRSWVDLHAPATKSPPRGAGCVSTSSPIRPRVCLPGPMTSATTSVR